MIMADMPWGLVLGAVAIVALVALVAFEVGYWAGRRRRRISRWLRERADG